MERLIQDAANMKDVQAELGITVDASSMSFGNIVNAISVMQSSLGIAGTTSKEASTTIQGSVNSMKAAWQNLLVGIADDQADLDKLINDFVDSAITAGDNLIPRVETILGGLGKLITQAASRLVPTVVSYIVSNLPNIVQAGIQLIVTLAAALIQALPQLVASAPQIIGAIVNGLRSQWPSIRSAGWEAVNQLAGAIRGLAGNAWSWGSDLMANFVNGIRAWFGNLSATAANVASIVRSYIGFSEPEKGPLSNFHTFAPDMMKLFAQGIIDNEHIVESAMNDLSGIAASEIGGDNRIGPYVIGGAAGQRNATPAAAGASFRTDVNLNFTGSLSQLAMVLKPYIDVETTRVGRAIVPA